MDIAKDDQSKKNTLEEIKKREKILQETYEKLKKTTDNDIDINYILHDYQNYYNLKCREKENQINALKMILKHLDNLKKTDNREKIKEDKKSVSNEIKKLYKELDSIPK
jgi:hypothetical protein